MIRFGIISFAHLHADGYVAAIQALEREGRAKVVAIADNDKKRAEAKAKELSIEFVFNDYQKLLSSGTVDAVIITSENNHHVEQVKMAAEHGVHVLCEKPIGISVADLQKMQDALEKSADKVIFRTAFVCRFSPAVIEAKEVIASGTLGQIKAISATNHGRYPGGWFGDKELAGGGAIMDHTVHAADVIRFLTADEFCSVRAFEGVNIRSRIAVEDNALIYSRLQRTSIPVSIDCSWSRHDNWPVWGDLTLHLYCEQGVIKIDAFKPHIQVSSGNKFDWHGLGEDLNEKLLRSFCCEVEERQGQSIRCGDVASSQNKSLRAGFQDGARAVAVALAAYKSVSLDSAPVDIPFGLATV